MDVKPDVDYGGALHADNFGDAVRLTKDTGVIALADGHGTYPAKWCMFDCPCGCGENVALSLQQGQDMNATWSAQINGSGRLDIAPSVNRVFSPCRSHFFIRDSKVVWC